MVQQPLPTMLTWNWTMFVDNHVDRSNVDLLRQENQFRDVTHNFMVANDPQLSGQKLKPDFVTNFIRAPAMRTENLIN